MAITHLDGEIEKLSTESIQKWLANHKEAISLGLNVGQINRDKAQKFRLELTRRGVRY